MKCDVIDIGLISYRDALRLQRNARELLQKGEGRDTLFLLEHPHVITAGRNAGTASLLVSMDKLEKRGVEFIETDRGGDLTYHGPGQLVGYPVLALEPSRRDIVRYVYEIEEVLIRTLGSFSINSNRNEKNRGVWIGERKIASVGIRISRWVTSHGFALNVTTDLSYFSLIRPCGLSGCRMTSMEKELGEAPSMEAVKEKLTEHFSEVFEREIQAESVTAISSYHEC